MLLITNMFYWQASPSPGGIQSVERPSCGTPSPSPSSRRMSCALLHPDHARLLRRPSSPEHVLEEDFVHHSGSSSTASSLNSVAAAVPSTGSRGSDPWERDRDRRRSSTMTARYSLLDALDLEYALLRAAARGSIGPYSLSESLHKLTFTQSLAFPALARGLAGKRRSSQTHSSPIDPADTGMNAFAKIVTALVLMLVSIMVFGVVYKFVRTWGLLLSPSQGHFGNFSSTVHYGHRWPCTLNKMYSMFGLILTLRVWFNRNNTFNEVFL